MIKTKNISEMLTSLNEEYRFNKNTLPKYRNPALLSILRRNAGSSGKHSTLPITTPSTVSSYSHKCMLPLSKQ